MSWVQFTNEDGKYFYINSLHVVTVTQISDRVELSTTIGKILIRDEIQHTLALLNRKEKP